MKKVTLYALCLAAFFACKKEGGSGKKLYLYKVFVNDLLSEAYTYSSDMKPVRRDTYSTSLGQSTFWGFRIYEYEDGSISRVLQYNKDGVLTDKKTIQYDDSKKITRVDNFGNDAVMDSYVLYQYENQQLSKMVLYSAPPTKKTGETQVAFDTNGNLVSIRRYWMNSGNLTLSDSAHFTNNDKTFPAHWQLFEELLLEFPYDITLHYMPANSMYYYLPGGPPTKSTLTFTQKTYNAQGLITAQQYEQEVDNGLGISTYNYNLKYEYIE